MRILRIVYDWPPPWSGLAPHPYELTVSQSRVGHKVDVFCGRWPRAGDLEVPKGVNVHPILREPIPNSIFFTSSVILFFKYLLFRRRNKVDVIHCHGHFAIWIYLYRSFLKKFMPWAEELMTPLVAHFHNTAEGRKESLKNSGKEPKKESAYVGWPMMAYSDKLASQVATACIFVSEDNKNDAIKFYGVAPEKCFVVETGDNPELFTSVTVDEEDKSRRDLGFDVFDKIILNLGSMVERKNIHLLIQALSFLPPNYKLMLVGPGDSAYVQKLDQLIKGGGLEDRVLRVGYTPYPQSAIAFQIADLFVLLSSFEGLPKVVMQSLSTGVPCLVSGFKLSTPIKGLEYMDDISDPQEVARRIQDMVENPREVDAFKVTQLYSWDVRAKEIEKVYEYAFKHYL